MIPNILVVRNPVAQQVALGRRRGGGYPSTLMGTLAYIRQSFMDARYAAQVSAAFQKNPTTTPLPSYDAEDVALQPAAGGAMPVWFEVTRAWDIERVLTLTKDLGVADYTLVGVQEGYQMLDRLKAAGRPVIVSLNYPQPAQVTGRAWELHVAPMSGPDREKDAEDSTAMRTLRGNAAALVGGGVPIALSGLGLESPAQFHERILGAIEAGLSPDEALRALTLTPAKLLGLDGAMGSIDPGKWANLVVTQGDLFAKDGKVRHVFVEGEKFEISDAPVRRPQGGGRGRGGGAGDGGEAGRASAATTPAEAAALTGDWGGTLDIQGTSIAFTLTIGGGGEALTGRMWTDMAVTDLTGQQSGTTFKLHGTATPDGMAAMDVTLTGRLADNALSGTISVAGMGEFPLNARRRSPDASNTDGHDGGTR